MNPSFTSHVPTLLQAADRLTLTPSERKRYQMQWLGFIYELSGWDYVTEAIQMLPHADALDKPMLPLPGEGWDEEGEFYRRFANRKNVEAAVVFLKSTPLDWLMGFPLYNPELPHHYPGVLAAAQKFGVSLKIYQPRMHPVAVLDFGRYYC
jgi:hypothetical protein